MISLELPPLSETGKTKQQRPKSPLVKASRISLHALPPDITSTLGRSCIDICGTVDMGIAPCGKEGNDTACSRAEVSKTCSRTY